MNLVLRYPEEGTRADNSPLRLTLEPGVGQTGSQEEGWPESETSHGKGSPAQWSFPVAGSPAWHPDRLLPRDGAREAASGSRRRTDYGATRDHDFGRPFRGYHDGRFPSQLGLRGPWRLPGSVGRRAQELWGPLRRARAARHGRKC